MMTARTATERRHTRTGMLTLFAPLQPFDERVEESFQPGQDAPKDAGIDFGVS
jgi:hypothetical protein